MDIHSTGDIKGILDTIKYMGEMEEAVSTLYSAYAERWPGSSGFWNELAQEETGHKEYLEKMARIISERPNHFEKGRPFNVFAIKTSISGILANLQKVKNGEHTEKNAMAIARDLEQSFIESRYNEIVKTDDVEYNTLVRTITGETEKHRIKVEKKMKENP